MRSAITIATLMLYSSLASGQERPYQNSEALNYELTQGMFNKSRAEAMKANLGLQNWKLVDEFNQRNVTLKDERELWLARYRIYENVISLRGKDEVMKWVDDARSKLAASELEGYQRLGVHNPYNTRSYLRYYDHQTGELVASEVRGTYEDLERQRLDFEKQRERQLETQRSINAAYEQAMELYDKALAAKRDRDEAYQANAKARTNLGRGESQSPLPRVDATNADKVEIVGRWTTGSNQWTFGADGTFQIGSSGNRGQWKRTTAGIAIKYSGASAWINLTFVGETLVDQTGLIGRARLRKVGG